MKRRLFLLLPALALTALGCATKFTRANYDMIKEGVDDRFAVRQTLGDPDWNNNDLEWTYEHDDGFFAKIHFDKDGRVTGKEWMDSRSGEWSGRNPHANPPPGGETREQQSRTRQIDVNER